MYLNKSFQVCPVNEIIKNPIKHLRKHSFSRVLEIVTRFSLMVANNEVVSNERNSKLFFLFNQNWKEYLDFILSNILIDI